MKFHLKEDLYSGDRMALRFASGLPTPACPNEALFFVGIPPRFEAHMQGCEHCQEMLAKHFRLACPSDHQLYEWRSQGKHSRAMSVHLLEDGCPRCAERLGAPQIPEALCPPITSIVESAVFAKDLGEYESHIGGCERCQRILADQWKYTPPPYLALLANEHGRFPYPIAMRQFLNTDAGKALRRDFEAALTAHVVTAAAKYLNKVKRNRWARQRRMAVHSLRTDAHRHAEELPQIEAATTNEGLAGTVSRTLEGWLLRWVITDPDLVGSRVAALLITRDGSVFEKRPRDQGYVSATRTWEQFVSTHEILGGEIVGVVVTCNLLD